MRPLKKKPPGKYFSNSFTIDNPVFLAFELCCKFLLSRQHYTDWYHSPFNPKTSTAAEIIQSVNTIAAQVWGLEFDPWQLCNKRLWKALRVFFSSFLPFRFICFSLWVFCLHVSMHTTCMSDVYEGQKRASDSTELDLGKGCELPCGCGNQTWLICNTLNHWVWHAL